MDCQYVLQCKVNCNSAETISIERWKQLEIKTKNWKFWEVWKFIWKNWLGERKKLKGCTCVKVFTSHYDLSHHFSNLGRERRKKILKKLQRSLSNKICRKKNSNCLYVNVCNLQLVNLYVIRINVFGVWKVLTKEILLEKLQNWCEYQLFRDGGILKDTRSITKMNCWMSYCVSFLMLYLLFRIHFLLIWCIIFHIGQIM